MNKNKIVSIIIIIAVVVSGGSFYAGLKYGQNNNSAGVRGTGGFSNFAGNGMGMGGGMRVSRGANGAGFTIGEIISKDDKSITVKLRDGGSKIVFLSSSTSVMKTVDGNVNDLAVNSQITAVGVPNSDGSITARSIQMRPATSTSIR